MEAREREEERARAEQRARQTQQEEKQQREEQVRKMKDKRAHVIQEILATEKDYIRDLNLCIETYLGPSAAKVRHIFSYSCNQRYF